MLDYVTDLMCALSRVIVFGIERQRGKRTFTQSAKLQEIPRRKLRRGGPSDPIGVDNFEICDKKHGIYVFRSGDSSSGNLLALPLFRKIEISSTHHRNIKYYASQ